MESKVVAQQFMKIIHPILLQRKKCEHKVILKLKEKIELVVWIPLATTQRIVYEKYLSKRTVQDAMIRKHLAVDVINHLKTISRHPFLMEVSEIQRKINEKKKNLNSSTITSSSYSSNTKSNSISKNDINSDIDSLYSAFDSLNLKNNKDSNTNNTSNGNSSYKAIQKKSHSNNNDNYHDSDDGDSDNDDDGSDVSDRKISANADVFEIAGYTPTVEDLLQVVYVYVQCLSIYVYSNIISLTFFLYYTLVFFSLFFFSYFLFFFF